MIPVWSTACPDWAERLKKGLSIIPDPIYPDEAAHALAIFKQLRIVDAPGSPTFGESCAPWVFDLVAALFGSYDAQTGVRHIKEVFILIPKKNSKSTLAAGIMMTALLLNWRQAAGYTILAPTVEVAANAFNPARDMVRRDDDLDDLCQVQTHIRTITHRVTDTTLKVVAADPNTVSGIKSVGTLIDELWLFGKQCKAEDMLREAIGGLASRPEGFVVYTTTQSNEPPAGVFRQKLQYARDVRDGKIHDPHFLPVIFEHPPEMVESGAHLLMENLAMVNPNLGYSVDEAFLYPDMTLLGGSFQGLPVIVSQYVGDQLVLVNAPDIYLADDGGVAVDMSREASLEMQSEPTGDSTTPSPVELVSMFQTGSVAIRAERWINWRRRRTAAVAVITGVNYGSASGS